MKYFKFTSLIISLTLLSSCFVSGPVHFYKGPPRPKNEIVKLRIPGPITIEKIDGQEIDVPSIEDGFYEIYLLPGVHRIQFIYELYWGDQISGIMVTSDESFFEAKLNAGKVYELIYQGPEDENEAYWMQGTIKAQLRENKTERIINSHEPEAQGSEEIKTEIIYESR